MKKVIILLTLLILFSGCEVEKTTTESIEKVVEETLNYKVKGANNYFEGYKYYIPRGFQLRERKGNNHKLQSNNEFYYLYVDIVSYFHKKEIKTTNDDNNKLYFSKKISYNDNEGYIKVSLPSNDIYYIEVVYNYSKIEAYVKEENIEYAIKNSLMILSSIKYNEVILDTIIGEKTLDYQEEIYNFFDTKKEDSNFLDYIKEYDVYDKEDKIVDEDIIDEDIIESFDE